MEKGGGGGGGYLFLSLSGLSNLCLWGLSHQSCVSGWIGKVVPISSGSHQCGFKIMLLQHNFKATDQCDLDLWFQCGAWLHLTEVNTSRNKIRKKVMQGPFSKSMQLESQRYERLDCRQWGHAHVKSHDKSHWCEPKLKPFLYTFVQCVLLCCHQVFHFINFSYFAQLGYNGGCLSCFPE